MTMATVPPGEAASPRLSPASVVHLRWPEEDHRRPDLAAMGVPRLLHVAAGSAPPLDLARDEDWVREPATGDDVHLREVGLAHRLNEAAAPRAGTRPVAVEVDDDGLVRWQGRWVALSAVEAALARPLLAEAGHCVSREVLAASAFPGEERDVHTVDRAVRRVRRKLLALGIAVHGITGSGYLAELTQVPW